MNWVRKAYGQSWPASLSWTVIAVFPLGQGTHRGLEDHSYVFLLALTQGAAWVAHWDCSVLDSLHPSPYTMAFLKQECRGCKETLLGSTTSHNEQRYKLALLWSAAGWRVHGGCQGEIPEREMKVQDHDKQAWGGGTPVHGAASGQAWVTLRRKGGAHEVLLFVHVHKIRLLIYNKKKKRILLERFSGRKCSRTT